MKNMKKYIMMVMALVLAFSSSSAVYAAPKYDKTMNIYVATTKNGKVVKEERFQSLYITNVESKQKIIYAKSSNTEVAGINSFGSDYKDETIRYVEMKSRKPGSTMISFKIGEQEYQTKVNIKKYTNPLKYFSITRVKDGKKTNLANPAERGTNIKLSKTIKKPEIKMIARKDWKIEGWGMSKKSITDEGWKIKSPKKPVSQIVKKVPYTLKKGEGEITIWIDLVNTKNNDLIYLMYMIQ